MIYFESHVTLDPVFDEKLRVAKELCLHHGFRVAELLMQKRREDSPEKSKHDTFASSRDTSYSILRDRMVACINALKEAGYVVRRYKIEDVILDSRHQDELNLL